MPFAQSGCCDDGSIRSATTATITGSQRAGCESDTLATPEGCCFDGRRCDDVCIKVAAAHECQTICGAFRNSCVENSIAKVGNDHNLNSRSSSIDRSTQHNHQCSEDTPPRTADCHSQNTTEDYCCSASTATNGKILSNSGAPKVVQKMRGRSCHVPAKSCLKGRPESLSETSSQPDHAADMSSCEVEGGEEERKLDCQDTCCTNSINKGNKQPASTTESMCQDGCCTKEAEPTGYESSSCRDKLGNDSCDLSRRLSGQACQSHLDAALKKYALYLRIGRCICRSVLAPLDTCCSKQKRQQALHFTKLKTDLVKRPVSAPKHTRNTFDKDNIIPIPKISSADQIHNDEARRTSKTPQLLTKSLADIEMGSNESVRIRISISGMTCTSCSKKGMNVLNRIPGVASPNINFVAGTGEFELDRRSNPNEVISQFEHDTGFKCLQFRRENQSIDLLMSKSEAKQLEDKLIAGVQSISKLDNKTYSIDYDPRLIGARSLFALVPSGSLAAPRNTSSIVNGKKKLYLTTWSTVSAAALTVPVVVLAWSNNSIPYCKRSVVSLVLATCVQGIAVPEFYVGALKSLVFGRILEMDMLVVISITAAYAYSVVALALKHLGYVLEQGEIFETSTLLVTLVLLGRLVSAIARIKAFTAISFKSLQAEVALLVDESGQSSEMDARLLEYGDTILIRSYARIVTDGKIISGCSAVDESMITGEAILTSKTPGDIVIAGTMNGSTPLTIRLTRLPGRNSITDIADLVESALNSKPRVQDLADKVASWFISTVVCISLVVFAIWFAIAFKVRKQNAGGSIGLAITYGIAVLAVSCPCALGLAVPMVLIIAGGLAAKSGIVIKQASATERAYRTTDVIFDKTGTLTTGTLEVVEESYYDTFLRVADVKSLICALLRDNTHPVSSAVVSHLKNQVDATIRLEDIQTVPGAGLKARWNANELRAGNPYWLGVDAHPEICRLIQRGMTVLGVMINSDLVAAYGFENTLRSEATAVVQDLHRRKLTCHIVSGDGPKAVENVARTVGIEQPNIASRQTPSSKQEYVKMLIDQGKTVLFCGDGTNDAVAIAQAHIGVQIGSTSDITRATADVVLTGGLEGIPTLFDISKQAFLRIVFNIVWSGIYNSFAILLAAGAFVKVRIPPAYAGLGELVSVLPVILVTMTLMTFRRKTL